MIRRGNPAERKVALTFDIEIDDVTLYGILDVLRARGLRGTFFVTGRWVEAFPWTRPARSCATGTRSATTR